MIPVAFLLPLFNADPAPSITRSKWVSRGMDCERISVEEALTRRPGRIAAAKARGDFITRGVVLCTERLTHPGVRDVRDEAVLSTLAERTRQLASHARAWRPSLETSTWLVETYYPNSDVASKIGFAIKNALMDEGLSVSDRVPTLAVGDIDVITRMQPEQAYPAACKRYDANGSVGDDDTLLGIVSLDSLDTALHAGVCRNGVWTWLR